ncbi:hypothetical protein M501DRAFT_1053552 [Patellaria atrata CBS 101060]|uniref:Extracellular membrane protein CFEM domain-containing protein n=1 Tax=Patellaria atrata CBS 101060 TaxID=1346257 RepID=A0A9P4SJ40_9PEZI|nr:hypothetical protein M501DRAFT_1053552 [Patellaria atrata CBS 101060]
MLLRIVLLLTFLTVLPFTVADGLISLDSSNGFRNLRSCALVCYNGGIRDGYEVANQLDCRKPGLVYVPPDNDCFCRSDLQETAVRYLSNCAFTSCSGNQLDASSATQVYEDYCSSAGYTAAAPNSVSAQTTGGIMRTSTSSSGTLGETGSSGSDTSNSDQPFHDDGSNFSIGGIVGIGAGVVGAIAAVIGCFYMHKQYQKQKRQGTQANLEYSGQRRIPPVYA